MTKTLSGSGPSPQVRNLISQFGFEFDYQDEELPDPKRRIQVREEKHYAPRGKVEEIRAALRRGEPIAPVVLTQDGYYVDGNTRGAAYYVQEVRRAPAVVLRVDFEGADEVADRNLRGLAAALNIRNGKGLDDKERALAVKAMLSDPEMTQERVAGLLGVPTRMVRQISEEIRGRERLNRVFGREVNGSVSATVARYFGPRMDKWHSGTINRIAELVVAAGLNGRETLDVIRRVESGDSDEAQTAIIEDERRSLEPLIQRRRQLGANGKTPSYLRALRVASQLNDMAPEDMVFPGRPAVAHLYEELADKLQTAVQLFLEQDG
jgi:hypothetical protein